MGIVLWLALQPEARRGEAAQGEACDSRAHPVL